VREDEHTQLSLGDRLGRDRVDAFDDDVVLGDVEACLRLAFRGEGRPDLGQPVVVEGVDAESRLELRPGGRILGPRLASEAAEPERQLGGIDAPLAQALCDVQGVARRGEEYGGAHGLQKIDLSLGRDGRAGRYDEAPEPCRGIVAAHAGDPEAVREGVLDDVARPHAELPQRAGCDVRDRLGVAGRPDRVHRRAGCPGGRVNLPEVGLIGDGEGTERRMPLLVLAQLLLRDHGQPGKVFQTADIARLRARGRQLRAIERRGRVATLDLAPQQPLLKRA
jgi:hypothetical protein